MPFKKTATACSDRFTQDLEDFEKAVAERKKNLKNNVKAPTEKKTTGETKTEGPAPASGEMTLMEKVKADMDDCTSMAGISAIIKRTSKDPAFDAKQKAEILEYASKASDKFAAK